MTDDENEGYPGIAHDFETCKRELAEARAEVERVQSILLRQTQLNTKVITDRDRLQADLARAREALEAWRIFGSDAARHCVHCCACQKNLDKAIGLTAEVIAE